ADPALGAVTETGFTAADSATIALSESRAAGEAVGNYATTATASGAALTNYDVTYVGGNFSITPASLVITASSASLHYGSPVPAITASYAGFKFADGPGSLASLPICSTTYTPTSPAGS